MENDRVEMVQKGMSKQVAFGMNDAGKPVR